MNFFPNCNSTSAICCDGYNSNTKKLFWLVMDCCTVCGRTFYYVVVLLLICCRYVCNKSKPKLHCFTFVADLLYNKLYNESTTKLNKTWDILYHYKKHCAEVTKNW